MTSRGVQTQLTEERVREFRDELAAMPPLEPRSTYGMALALADAYLAQQKWLRAAEEQHLHLEGCAARKTVWRTVDGPPKCDGGMSVKGKRSVLIRCDCIGGCTILGMDWYPDLWDDGQYNDWFAEFYRSAGQGSRWFRVKKAWAVLRGREDATLDDMVVSHADAVRLRDFLSETLAEHDVLLAAAASSLVTPGEEE